MLSLNLNTIQNDYCILNALYADRTIFLDPIRYNFDVRYYPALHALSFGKISVKTIPKNTCIVHYCGKHKPWHEDYRGECSEFYWTIHERVFCPSGLTKQSEIK